MAVNHQNEKFHVVLPSFMYPCDTLLLSPSTNSRQFFSLEINKLKLQKKIYVFDDIVHEKLATHACNYRVSTR
jgi:hypothetical protein